MVAAAWDGAGDADMIALIVDGRAGAGPKVEKILEGLKDRPERKWLVLNKVDIAAKDKLLALTTKLTEKCAFEQIYYISAATGDGLEEFKTALADNMPEGEWHFPEDQLTDATTRLMAAEITREQLYQQLHEELPYDSAVRPEKYELRKDGSVEIHQQIVVTRDNQRAIVLGKGGSKIKAIGAAARAELMEVLGVKVHLFLHVKVLENWAEDKELFEEIGLDWVR
jgi:GTP-binding protein Era